MSDRHAPRHLRLVTSHTHNSSESDRIPQRPQRQLSFPYPDSSAFFFVNIDTLNREAFAQILSEYVPRWIIDVRAVPRLDTIASSRTSAFDLFERARLTYVDLFGRLGIKSYTSAESNPAFWGDAISELLRNSDRKGPYLLLFDNDQLMKTADAVLQEILKPAFGKEAHLTHIPQLEFK